MLLLRDIYVGDAEIKDLLLKNSTPCLVSTLMCPVLFSPASREEL